MVFNFFLKAHFLLSTMFISYGEILFLIFICLLTKYFHLLTPDTLSVSLHIWWPLLYRLCDSCHCILDWYFFCIVSLHMAWLQSRRQKYTLKASMIQCFDLSQNHSEFFYLYFFQNHTHYLAPWRIRCVWFAMERRSKLG